eukprot:PhM_4_TR13269/c0_g1_i2/m.48519/K12384/SCARB2, LIMP2, CD36L2; lysosome membrane protein 2
MWLYQRVCVVVLLCLSLILLGLGILFFAGTRPYVLEALHRSVPLTGTSSRLYPAFHNFVTSGVYVYRDVYIFNITNAHDLCSGQAKRPHAALIGPYVYRVNRVKSDISWPEPTSPAMTERDLIQYTYETTFTFVPDRSKHSGDTLLSESDEVITFDLGLMSAIDVAVFDSDVDDTTRDAIVRAINKFTAGTHTYRQCYDTMFGGGRRTVADVLWGTASPLLEKLHSDVDSALFPVTATNSMLLQNGTIPAPPSWNATISRSTTKSMVKQNNKKQLPKYSMQHTGAGNFHQLGELVQWSGATDMSWWGDDRRASKSSSCDTVRSFSSGKTDGLYFTPDLDESNPPELFVDFMYRSFKMVTPKHNSAMGRVAPIDIRDVPTHRLEVSFSDEKYETCFNSSANGLWPLRTLVHAPVVGSPKGFWGMDVSYVNTSVNVDGKDVPRSPSTDAENDGSYVDVEPVTGITCQFHFTTQFSLSFDATTAEKHKKSTINTTALHSIEVLSKTGLGKFFAKDTRQLVPLVQTVDHGRLPHSAAETWRNSLSMALQFGVYGGTALVGSSVMLVLLALVTRRNRVKDMMLYAHLLNRESTAIMAPLET